MEEISIKFLSIHSNIIERKGKMRRNLRKLFGLVLVAFVLINSPTVEAFAAEDIQTVDENVVELKAEVKEIVGNSDIIPYATTFSEASITISFSSAGMLVEIATCTTKTASVVGCKDIVIQKKGLFGWTTVATSSGGESYNVTGSLCTVLYAGAEKGATYRVLCTHYANVDGYNEASNESGGVTCTY